MSVINYPADLPICARREEIVAALRTHQVLIIAGETGSGKTTQLPKMCLEAGLDLRGKIGCTQPRRVAAMSVSRRVAEELGVTWGREVGCKMRFNDDTGRDTKVKFMTDGILLAEIQSDPLLRAYSALILDEAHERSLNIDFLLGYLQGLLRRRGDLKLIVTSATIDTEAFSRAFGGAPIIQVSGRLFPVEVRYSPIESRNISTDPRAAAFEELSVVEAAARATEDALIEFDSGDLLVFMPTERDIRDTRDLLEGSLGSGIEVLGLYGRLTNAEQQRIFTPGDRRRVIVATNIAETSLTIPRIGAVIDAGLARMSRYNPRTRTKRLPVEPISQSSANQRAGRAGRVRDGVCIRLYSQEDFDKRPLFTQPEIQRANLAEVILRMKAFRLGEVEDFPFLSPPQPESIRAGYQLLQELGALTQSDNATIEGNQLTPLGCELARLPLDPTLGRMLLQARTEGALPEMLIIAAGLSIPDPRERPEEEKEAAAAAHRAFAHPDSDFLTLLNIWRLAPDPEVRTSRNALRRFCSTNYLSPSRMREWRDVHRQLSETIEERIVDPRLSRRNEPRLDRAQNRPKAAPAALSPPERASNPVRPAREEENLERSYHAVHRSILAGLLSQIGFRQERNLYKASSDRAVTLFPGSNLYERNVKKPKSAPAGKGGGTPSRQPLWIVSGEIVQTSQLFARTVARIDPQWVSELGAHLCHYRYTLPSWSAKAGRVLVWERVLIYGLELSKRQVDYGRINPIEATELFIRGALVADDARIPLRFFTENAKLREKIETALTRVRNSRVQDLDEAFYRFYADRIQGVSSIHDLNRFVKEGGAANPDFLCATESDLIDAGQLDYDRHLFPDQVALGNTVIPLTYAYNPGGERDGVTVRVPLPLAERLTAGELHWMVPGLREEQTAALLRALPKTIRKQLMPLEPKIREMVAEFKPGSGDLLKAFSSFIALKYRVIVQPEDWKSLPDYLRPRVEVVDRQNRTVASGRDLAAVHATMESSGVQSDGWDRAVRQFEKTSLVSWSFGDLPESLVVEEVGGAPLLAYPGVVAGGKSVDLRLFRKRQESETASALGVRQLAEQVMAREVVWLFKELRALSKYTPGNAPKSGKGAGFDDALSELSRKLQTPKPHSGNGLKQAAAPDILQTSAAQHILGHLLALNPVLPLTAARFHAMIDAARRELPALTHRVGELARQIFDLREAVLRSQKRYAGMEHDVERLVPVDFLAHTANGQLPHLLRYLRAVQIRAERAWLNPAKDLEKAKQLAQFANWRQRVPEENQHAFRWLLEEFRVSLFAQELGTAQPVSLQRLNALCG
ncbi:MAG: hrpB 1 [Chthoniobacteraceae bacterium]|nr:hrpB 1 [Chthoniobacteraceae bacterium]